MIAILALVVAGIFMISGALSILLFVFNSSLRSIIKFMFKAFFASRFNWGKK